MNGNQELFVEDWIRNRDRISALQAGGYQTSNRQTAMICYRRLMQRDDVKAAIREHDLIENPRDQAEIDKAIEVCWAMINKGGREASTFMGHLLKLKGWDKASRDDGEADPPTFANMPFTPPKDRKP